MTETRRRHALWVAMVAAVVITAVFSAFAVLAATAAADLDGDATGRPPPPTRQTATIPVPPLVPGDSASRCVEVGSGDGTGVLRVHGATSGGLVEHLSITVERGTAGRTCDHPGPLTTVFAGPLDRFGADFASGHDVGVTLGSGPPAPHVVTVTLGADVPNAAQGERASLVVTWEVRAIDPGD